MKKLWIGGLAAAMSLMTAAPAFAGSWIQDTNRPANQDGISNWWYRNDDGTYPANGWYWLDGNKDGWAESYRFDGSGWMYVSGKVDNYDVDGSGAWTIGGEVQRRQISSGQGTGGSSESGAAGTGSSGSGQADTASHAKNQWVNDDYGRRYYNSKGELTTGWKKISGSQYYFDDSGYALTGYQEVDGSEYYFYSDGEMAKKTVHDTEDGVYYVLDKSEYYVVDVVAEDEWSQYRREADRESVNVSDVKNESKEEETNSSVSNSYRDLDNGLNEEWAMACFDLINEEREKNGREPLEFDATIYEACEIRAEEIAEKFSHTRPDGSSCFTVFEEVGVTHRAAGENIAGGQISPEAAVEAWMNSSGHKANILNKSYTHAAVGCYVLRSFSGYGIYWVQMFAN